MVRSWGVVILTGSAQPVFGSVTTGAVPLTNRSTGQITVPVSVADSLKFQAGDRIVLDPGTVISTVPQQDTLLIDRIDTTTGIMYCKSEGDAPTHVHPNGTIVMLSIACRDIIVQSQAAGAVWIGTDKTVTAAGGTGFYRLDATPSAPFRLAGSAHTTNTDRTSDLWMIGTGTQTVSAAAVVL